MTKIDRFVVAFVIVWVFFLNYAVLVLFDNYNKLNSAIKLEAQAIITVKKQCDVLGEMVDELWAEVYGTGEKK